MAANRATALLRKPGQPERATFLELFFDLVFVFALTRVSQRLVEDLTTERPILSEAGGTLLVFLALLLVWFVTTLITDLYDPQRPEIQMVVVATMFGIMVMAVALAEAFGEQDTVFAGAYVAIHVGRSVFLLALRAHEAQRIAGRMLVWFGISAVPWIAGALLPEAPARIALWTLAVAVDYTGALLRWPTPALGGTHTTQLRVVAEHLSERYRQFFVIALGELILVTGLTYSGGGDVAEGVAHLGLGAGRTVGFVVSFATTVLLWRIYIYRAGELLPAAIAAATDPARLGRYAVVAHLLMVAGIVAIAVGDALVIDHPSGHIDPAWIFVILGGPALFLTGRAIFECAVFARVSRSRLIGVLVLAAISPAMVFLSPLVVAIAPALVLAGIAISDTARAKGRPPEQPSPPR